MSVFTALFDIRIAGYRDFAPVTSAIGTRRSAWYNNAYIQCMYVKGHSVPVPANMAYPQQRTVSPVNSGAGIPPPPGAPPPPPPGIPPPPPPR